MDPKRAKRVMANRQVSRLCKPQPGLPECVRLELYMHGMILRTACACVLPFNSALRKSPCKQPLVL